MKTLFLFGITGLVFLGSANSARGTSAPFMAGDTWWVSRGPDQCGHTGSYRYGVDFNYGVGTDDLGMPVVASADGIVVYAGMNGDWGNTVVVQSDAGGCDRVAHLDAVFVVYGEEVGAGQVLGVCGTTGNSTAPHIHHQRQQTAAEGSIPFTYEDIGAPTGPPACTFNDDGNHRHTSLNDGVFEEELARNGGTSEFGNLGGATPENSTGIHWYHAYDPDDLYRGGNVPNNCYVQNWAGGPYGHCGIVYDALGGARRAYTIRTGFWQNTQGNGWSQPQEPGQGGPAPAPPGMLTLGMPITDEYETDPGYASRQDFVGGWLNWINGVCARHTWPVCSPGWTTAGWDPQVSYRIADIYAENGASEYYGAPTAAADHDANGWFQDFDNHGPIRVPDVYQIGGQGGPEPATFACSYVANSATITPSVSYHPGDLIQFGMLFKNEGSATWQKTPGSNYVVLAACDADGNIGASPFNMPYDTGLGWLAQSTPGCFDNAAVAPGTNANLAFAGRIRPDATAGSYSVFFAPSHDGAVIPGWTGCRFDFTVTAMPAAEEPYNAWIAVGDYNGGGKADLAILDRRGVGSLRIDYGENGFGVLDASYDNYGTPTAVWICAGNYNGDGYSDYTQFEPGYQHGTLKINQGSTLSGGFDASYDWYGTATSIKCCPGDYNGDGYTDYAQLDPTYQHGTLMVNYGPNIENGFETFLDYYGTSANILPCPADYNGDGYTDYAQFDPGSQQGTLAVNYGYDLSDGFVLPPFNYYGTSTGILPCPADYNGDGYDDYAQYEQNTGYFRINYGPDLSDGFGQNCANCYPNYGISSDIQPCAGDYDGDGKADFASFNRSTGVFAINYGADGFANGFDAIIMMRTPYT